MNGGPSGVRISLFDDSSSLSWKWTEIIDLSDSSLRNFLSESQAISSSEDLIAAASGSNLVKYIKIAFSHAAPYGITTKSVVYDPTTTYTI